MYRKIIVGVIGCGAIGGNVVRELVNRKIDNMRLGCVYDIDEKKMKIFSKKYKVSSAVSISEVIDKVDLVVETASKNVVNEILQECISKKKDVLILSIGGIIENLDILQKIRSSGIKLYLPSGAIAGIDGIKSSSVGKIEKIELVTIKPKNAFLNNKYLQTKGIDVNMLKKTKILYSGDVKDAIKFFPENINVAGMLYLASVFSTNKNNMKKIKVTIICNPGLSKNVHKITLYGDLGKISIVSENVPSKANPKTSMLAMYSAITTLKQIADNIKVGT